jgi:hypothetical protein
VESIPDESTQTPMTILGSRASGHFLVMTTQLQGTMKAFGEMCCRPTYSHPERACCVDILPSDLPAIVKAGSGRRSGRRVWVWRIPYHVALTNDDHRESERIMK